MASKRTTNRAYWTAVKALTIYRDCLSGQSDTAILSTIQRLEEALGPHKPNHDLNNPALFKARPYVDLCMRRANRGEDY
jgi:hypothetical protein